MRLSLRTPAAAIVGRLLIAAALAVLLLPAVAQAAEWAPNTAYTAGQLVTYQGPTYKCIQSHTSLTGWEPPNVPALWKKL